MSGAFRFNDLARETQVHVLQYTDLVTPSRTVVYDWGHFSDERNKLPRKVITSDPKRFPQSSKAPKASDDAGVKQEGWSPPTALFLVSRAFSSLAQSVLLSQNSIVVKSYSPRHLRKFGHKAEHFALYEQLQQSYDECKFTHLLADPLRAAAVANIRSIKIEWPDGHSCRQVESPRVWSQWGDVLERYSDSFVPRRLFFNVSLWDSIPINDMIIKTTREGVNLSKCDLSVFWQDLIRSVNTFWPRERLGLAEGVQLLLWTSEVSQEGAFIVYYCRHVSEPLEGLIFEGIFAPQEEPWIRHIERPFKRCNVGAVDASCPSEGSSSWVEGIYWRDYWSLGDDSSSLDDQDES